MRRIVLVVVLVLLAAGLSYWLLRPQAGPELELLGSGYQPVGSMQVVPSNYPFGDSQEMYRAPGRLEAFSQSMLNVSGQPLRLRLMDAMEGDIDPSVRGLRFLRGMGWQARAFWVPAPRSMWPILRRGGGGPRLATLPRVPLERAVLAPGAVGWLSVQITNLPLTFSADQGECVVSRAVRSWEAGGLAADVLLRISRPQVRVGNGQWRWARKSWARSDAFFAPVALLVPRCGSARGASRTVRFTLGPATDWSGD